MDNEPLECIMGLLRTGRCLGIGGCCVTLDPIPDLLAADSLVRLPVITPQQVDFKVCSLS